MKCPFKWLRQSLAFALLILINTSIVAQQDTTRVLFVGNSFTYFYNLPQVVTAMASTQDVIIETRQSTVGGSTLEQHWNEERGTQTRAMLENGSWDYVVFNNHSLATIEAPDKFMEYSEKFTTLVREKGAEPVFMMTWAYRSNPLMQAAITTAYEQLSEATSTDYVPCGPLFAKARSLRPDLELFFDDKHPSYNGTYLLGLAFYKYFTGRSTAEIPHRLSTLDINAEKLYLIFMQEIDANFLQQLVDDFEYKVAN